MVRNSNGRSTPPPHRAAVRAEARRVEILRAAARVFRARGYAAAGMRDIAEAAGLATANLYYYFTGKDELLFFCQDRTLDRLLAAADRAQRERGPMPGRLRELAVAHLTCLLDDVEGSAAHLEVDALPSRLRGQIVAKRDQYEQKVRRLVASGVRRRELGRVDPVIATRAFLGALNWTVQWYRPEGPDRPARIAAAVADYAVAGLGTPGGGRRADHADAERRTGHRRVPSVQDAARGPA